MNRSGVVSLRDRSGRVKENSGATSAEEEEQEDQEDTNTNTLTNTNTNTKQAYGYLAQHDFSCQACLACSLCAPQASQKRYNTQLEIHVFLVSSKYCSNMNLLFAAGAGLLKLQDDVETCGYQDVQVMWEMLQRTESEVVIENHQKRKQLPFWRIFVWSNHNEVSSESANHT
ncbi:hypothetical protein E2542_SST25406 [Spatholobus suberectus]|nr:hypothetical protein E2542_SST25406 [Spatholobus suberectus]